MKWRKGKADGSDAAAGGVLWAQSGRIDKTGHSKTTVRLWRVLAMPDGAYMVPGLLRWVDTPMGTRNERRRFATVYGARMAAECEKRRCA
jgi:hypothetical protein